MRTDESSPREPQFFKAILDPRCPWCRGPNDTNGVICSECRAFMNKRAEEFAFQPVDVIMFDERTQV